MEINLIEVVASLGVGAVFGLVVFFIYRIDRKATEKMWRESKIFTEDRLSEIIESNQKIIQESTKILTELNTYLRVRNGIPH